MAKLFSYCLFDLDDTLLDFQKSSEISFFSNFKALDDSIDAATLYESFQKISRGLWKQYTQGEVERSFLKVERFRRTFTKHNVPYDPDVFAKAYLDGVCENVESIKGAISVCQKLKAVGKRLGIVTNGIGSVQSRRLEHSPLRGLVDFVLTSDKGRRPKPAPDLFLHAWELWDKPHKEQVLMVGDNIVCDILGGKKFGYSTCWFNPEGHNGPPDIRPDHQVRSLPKLLELSGLSEST